MMKLIPLIQAFEGLHDLEEDKEDREKKDYHLSWGPVSSMILTSLTTAS